MEYSRKVGMNKGKPRVWLEGEILASHGFHHGAAWQLQENENGLRILLGSNEEGLRVRKVSGKAGRPVIDITGATIARLNCSAVRIIAGNGILIVVPA